MCIELCAYRNEQSEPIASEYVTAVDVFKVLYFRRVSLYTGYTVFYERVNNSWPGYIRTLIVFNHAEGND